MDHGIIGMPFDMAMGDELSRQQFYARAQAILAERDQLRAEVEALREDVEAGEQWRALALQFDRHRMSAIWHLKALLGSAEHAGAAHDFLDAPPVQGNVLWAEIEALRKDAARWNWYAPQVGKYVGEGIDAVNAEVDAAMAAKEGDL